MAERTDCVCMNPPLHYDDFEIDPVSDSFHEDANGGEITVEKCRHCGTKWLCYFVEYPAFTSSGRWCRGVVTDDELSRLGTEMVLSCLGGLPWHLYGEATLKLPVWWGRGGPSFRSQRDWLQ